MPWHPDASGFWHCCWDNGKTPTIKIRYILIIICITLYPLSFFIVYSLFFFCWFLITPLSCISVFFIVYPYSYYSVSHLIGSLRFSHYVSMCKHCCRNAHYSIKVIIYCMFHFNNSLANGILILLIYVIAFQIFFLPSISRPISSY